MERDRLTVNASFDGQRYAALERELTREFNGAAWFEPENIKIEKDKFSFSLTCPASYIAAAIAARFFPGHSVSTSFDEFSCRYAEDSPDAKETLFRHKLIPTLR